MLLIKDNQDLGYCFLVEICAVCWLIITSF